MREDQTPEWVKYLNEDLVGKDVPGVGLVYGVTLKLGFDGVLGILRAKGGGGKLVAFVGARNLKEFTRKVRQVLTGESGKWRDDQYA